MPRVPLDRPATYDDLAGLPDHVVGEIVDSELWSSPRPRLRHGRAAWKLASSLDSPFDRGVGGPGGWLFLAEPELHLGADVVAPDLAGWRRDRLPSVPDEAFLTLAPDWVCEIASPSTQRFDRGAKMKLYFRERVGHLWLLEPAQRYVEVFRRQDDGWLRVDAWTGETPARIEPFETVEIDLDTIWDER